MIVEKSSLLLAQYQALWSEMQTRINHNHNVPPLVGGLVAAVFAVAADYPRKVIALGTPFMGGILALYVINNLWYIASLSECVARVEERLNRDVGEVLLIWQHRVGARYYRAKTNRVLRFPLVWLCLGLAGIVGSGVCVVYGRGILGQGVPIYLAALAGWVGVGAVAWSTLRRQIRSGFPDLLGGYLEAPAILRTTSVPTVPAGPGEQRLSSSGQSRAAERVELEVMDDDKPPKDFLLDLLRVEYEREFQQRERVEGKAGHHLTALTVVVGFAALGWQDLVELFASTGGTAVASRAGRWLFALGYGAEVLLLVGAVLCHLRSLAVREIDHLPLGKAELEPQLNEPDWRERLVDVLRESVSSTRCTRKEQAQEVKLGNILLQLFVLGVPVTMGSYVWMRLGADAGAVVVLIVGVAATSFVYARGYIQGRRDPKAFVEAVRLRAGRLMKWKAENKETEHERREEGPGAQSSALGGAIGEASGKAESGAGAPTETGKDSHVGS